MGRLIDTDVLEKFIKTHSCSVGTDGVLLTVGEDKTWHNLLEYIPTAHDVDKVVEELEKQSKPLGIGLIPDERYIKEKKAIEIVKQCGVADDVCEWKMDNVGASIGCRSDLHHTGYVNRAYCPFCEKRIKVVEKKNGKDI